MPLRKEIDPRITALVRLDNSVRKMRKPDGCYSESPNITEVNIKSRNKLAQELGLSDQQIFGWKGLMVREGHPFWKTGNGDLSVYVPGSRTDQVSPATNNGHHPDLGREIKPGEVIEVRKLAKASA